MQFNELSICDIADAISKDPDFDLRDHLDAEEILQLLQSIGSADFKMTDFETKSVRTLERTMKTMKKKIFEYVKRTCSCII